MKRTLIFCLLMAIAGVCNAQYDAAVKYRATMSFYEAMDSLIARAAANPADTGEGGQVNTLRQQKYFMGSRVSNDVTLGDDITGPMSASLSYYMVNYNDYCPGSGYTGNWKCTGPFNGYWGAGYESQGRINAIWVDPLGSDTILVGADAGGVWKTTNGGRSWHNITDGAAGGGSQVLGMLGVTSIAVNPFDHNIIYINSNGRDESKKTGGYSLGLIYTVDGGSHWYTDAAFAGVVNDTIAQVKKIAYMPGTQQLYAIYGGKVLCKASPSAAWTDITPPGMGIAYTMCTDMDFSKQIPGKTIVTVNAFNDTSHLFVYDGSTWSHQRMCLLPTDSQDYRNGAIHLSVSGTDSAYIVFATHVGDTQHTLLIATPISSFAPNKISTDFPGIHLPSVTQFVVSPANSNIIYAVNYNGYDDEDIYKSLDGGQSFTPCPSGGHGDGRCIFLDTASAGPVGLYDVVYIGNDGGIRKKRSGTSWFDGITGDSLAITEFYGFGNAECDENIMAAGAQDNGGFGYIKTNPTPWTVFDVGDAYTTKMMRNGVREAIGGNCPGGDAPWPVYGISFTGGIGRTYYTTPADLAISNTNRPFLIDQNNTTYTGYSHIWKMPYGGGAWARAFTADPIDYSTGAFPNLVVDFYIDENNTDNVYVAYREPTNGKSPAIDTFAKLYYSNDAAPHTAPPNWHNITPSICMSNGINSIAVDPLHFNRIWVAFGNTNAGMVGTPPASMSNRVKFSNDTGRTWIDVSTGLPGLPVNKIIYRKGSDDELFAGTDAGVFRWDKAANSWYCYNNGLPPCTVMDMEFNYCANKLRIATFGRGIWETKLDTIDVKPDSLTNIITGYITWTSDKWLTSSVLIKAGSTLDISGCTIHMPTNGKIIVERGAQLVVDHATITNSCEKCYWQGIRVAGDNSLSQSPYWNQGSASIINGSTIEHAQRGVCNYNPDEDTRYYTGGIITCFDSKFINCQNAATFKPYHNKTTGGTLAPDVSIFQNCAFTVDQNYKDRLHTPFINHVSLTGVEGIQFKGCGFFRSPNGYQIGNGEGIHAEGSGFSVGVYTGGGTYPRSHFSGFFNGISISQGLITGGGAVSLDASDFDSCGVGVFISAYNDVSTTNCNFNVGRADPGERIDSCYENVGIFTQHTPAFRIERNTFNGVPYAGAVSHSSWSTYGVVAANTTAPSVSSNVSHCTFDSLSYGVCAAGINKGIKYSGLQILCNVFSGNTNDILIIPVTATGLDGLSDQGSLSWSAGNVFSSGTTPNIFNNCGRLYYYCDVGSPLPRFSGTVSLYTGSVSYCLMPIWAGGGWGWWGTTSVPVASLPAFKVTFDDNNTVYNNALAVMNSRVDFGSTAALVNHIDTSTIPAALYSYMNSGSPFISETALKEVADLTALTYTDMLHLLKNNSDNLRNSDFVDYVQSIYSFSSADQDTLAAAALRTTCRTKLEDTIHTGQLLRSNAANLIIMALKSPVNPSMGVADTTGANLCTDSTSVYYMQDSNAVYIGMDSLDTWLQKIGDPWTWYERVGYYYSKGQVAIADSIFTGINSVLAPGDSLGRQTYATYTALWNVMKSAYMDGRSVFDLNSAEIDTLSLLVPSTSPFFDVDGAKEVIYDITRHDIAPVIMCWASFTIPYESKGTHGNAPHPVINKNGSDQFWVYPNPANGIVTFMYNVPDGGNDIRVVVTNLLGEKVMEQHTGNNRGSISWDPRSLPPGVYIYQASNAKGMVSKGRLVLVR